MRMFVDKDSTEVVSLGVSYLKAIAFMYIMPAMTNIVQGFFRGMGELKISLASTMANMAARVFAAYILICVMGNGFSGLAWANFWGWIFMMLFEVPLLIKHLIKMAAGKKNY